MTTSFTIDKSATAAFTGRQIVALVPYSLLQAAAMFASSDVTRGVITTIRVRSLVGPDGPLVELVSTDGHRCFRVHVPVSEHTFAYSDAMRDAADGGQEFLIAAKPLRKRITGAKIVKLYNDGLSEIICEGGTVALDTLSEYTGAQYPNITQLWPPDFGVCGTEAPIAFNSSYLAGFCDVVTRLGVNSVVRLFRNGPTTPAVLTAKAEILGHDDPVELSYLIMPVQVA